MKLKDYRSGKIWKIDSISASDENGEKNIFWGGYELISDEPQLPQESPHLECAVKMNTQSIENIITACVKTLERVSALESDNQRLNDRLNAIE